MSFLWHLRGSVKLRSAASDEASLEALEELLEKQRKSPERGSASIIFESPLWSDFFGGGRAMAIYDSGRFWIEKDPDGRRLRYDLRSLQAMVFCLLGSLMFFFFGLASGGPLVGLKFAALAFAWVYGINVLLALARVPWAIHEAVRAA